MQGIQNLLTFFMLVSVLPACTTAEDDEYEEMADARNLAITKADTAMANSIDFSQKTRLQYDEAIDFNINSISRWMTQKQGEKSNQGADCYQNFLCQFRVDHTALDIMDMESRQHFATITLNSLGSAYHCNNADFSNTFYEETDAFPLLYSSHQGKSARCILVDRIYKDGNEYRMETIQRIEVPFEIDDPLQYTPDAILDKDNHFLYVYTGNTIPITDFYIYKFRLPSIHEGEVVRLTKKDAVSCWTINDSPSYYKQGGMIKDNVLYIMEGVPGWNTDNILRVIDLNREGYKLINLSKALNSNWEPEDIFIFNNNFFIASNRAGIYKLELDTNASAGIVSPRL